MVLTDGKGHTTPQTVMTLCLLFMTTSDNHVSCQVPRINLRMKLSSIATVIGLGCPGFFSVAAVGEGERGREGEGRGREGEERGSRGERETRGIKLEISPTRMILGTSYLHSKNSILW